ncbi:hypothetical protein FO519_005912 [Halicephalobus sp. NKZ332]|nr:hypothetical protein FO519_005912 [Halicephalobus sp. NKZ332]
MKTRPGECPSSIPVRLDECSAACDKDGDCPGAEKCCTAGCSRLCVSPVTLDKRLLPVPEGISVQERKRKRSAVVRWVMKRLSKSHMATNSNLYIIQWRWGTRREEASMTPWQTIIVKNKMYAILKHLLMPGRYYIFRVAAVNQYGSLGFSLPSAPFKLSKEVKAPSAPKNLTVESLVYDDTLLKWVPKISWLPPSSDLPIKDYQLSWWKSSMEFANAYEERSGRQLPEALVGRRSAEDEDYSNIDESIEKSLRSSTIIPSHATRTQLLDGLEPERIYMVELFATVDSTEGELRGEPSVIFIKTNSTNMLNDAESVRYDVKIEKKEEKAPSASKISSTTTKVPETSTTTSLISSIIPNMEIIMTEEELDEPRFDLDIRTPYFENGKLKTSISWIDSSSCSPTKSVFAVRLTPRKCEKSETKLMTVTQCVASIENLDFDCEYEVEVDDVNTRKIVSRAFFRTFPCESTPSTEPLPCSGNIQSSPRCRVLSQTRAVCEWPVSEDPTVIGYRTILSSPISSSKIGVASTHSPKMEFEDLLPGVDYRFRLQPVTNKGLSPPVDVEFSTRLRTDKENPKRLDKYPILELPLESGSSKIGFSLSSLLILFFFRI